VEVAPAGLNSEENPISGRDVKKKTKKRARQGELAGNGDAQRCSAAMRSSLPKYRHRAACTSGSQSKKEEERGGERRY